MFNWKLKPSFRILKAWQLALVCLFSLLSFQVYGSSVLKVSRSEKFIVVSQNELIPLTSGDFVCINNSNSKRIACGYVVSAQETTASVLVVNHVEPIKMGYSAMLAEPGEKRAIASFNLTESAKAKREPALWDVSLGTNDLYPVLQIQRQVNPNFAVGLSLSQFNFEAYGAQSKSFGAQFTFNYYSHGPFNGLWIQGAGGLFTSDITYLGQSERHLTEGIKGLVGGRFFIGDFINIGGAIGVSIYQTNGVSVVPFNLKTYHPLIAIDIGIALP